MTVAEKFSNLGIDNAPGQESLQKSTVLEFRGEKIPGAAVDFSHGDVDAHEPIPGSFEVFAKGVEEGGSQAYTPYRGKKSILEHVAAHLSAFTGLQINPDENLILTPGTQGALFLAAAAIFCRATRWLLWSRIILQTVRWWNSSMVYSFPSLCNTKTGSAAQELIWKYWKRHLLTE